MGNQQPLAPVPPPPPPPQLGLMQYDNLLVSSILRFAERYHARVQVVSKRTEGDLHRYTYQDLAGRTKQLASALATKLGLRMSTRVATLAWNGYRHLELYYAVSGSGLVLHTLNPRLPQDQLVWIVNHAEDEVLFFDTTFLPIVKAAHDKFQFVKHYVMLCDKEALAAAQPTGIPNLQSYEEFIASEAPAFDWPDFDERAACVLCYTSGTTGNPKGVLYSHRSTVLHAFAGALPDALNVSGRDVILPVVPMFHVNAWGLVYSALMCGSKLVFPGPNLDGKSVYELMEGERVTFSAGVPTVWQMLLTHVQKENLKFSTLRRTIVGGSACPPALLRAFKTLYNVDVIHAWGMTEMSPLGSVCSLKAHQLELDEEEQMKIKLKQGRPPFGVEMKIVDPATGEELPWDGKTSGDLFVRGPWIVSGYFKSENSTLLQQPGNWFSTGDVANIDEDGFMCITDRSKDVIKSGGEWISSIDLENVAMAHPGVQMAACIGVKHPVWDERPIVVVQKKVPQTGEGVTKEELRAFYVGKVAKWQIPDDVVFVEAIPLGATGKMQKTKIREMLAGYELPEACVPSNKKQ